MGLFDRFRKSAFSGFSGDIGADFEELAGGLQDELLAQEFLIEQSHPVAVCRSPVLIVKDGKVLQPAAIVPAPMLTRFWTAEGREVLEGTELAPLVTKVAAVFVTNDKLAKTALSDVHDLFVTDNAPTSAWPVQDARLRLASLILVDAVRKLSSGFSDRELAASYGISRTTEFDEAARQRYDAMTRQEFEWIKSVM
jgi:hypothetical protein